MSDPSITCAAIGRCCIRYAPSTLSANSTDLTPTVSVRARSESASSGSYDAAQSRVAFSRKYGAWSGTHSVGVAKLASRASLSGPDAHSFAIAAASSGVTLCSTSAAGSTAAASSAAPLSRSGLSARHTLTSCFALVSVFRCSHSLYSPSDSFWP